MGKWVGAGMCELQDEGYQVGWWYDTAWEVYKVD